ncbi:MAG: hypothetical protein PUB40_08930 [Lachnospiraceae bacterium]|nr:hypothetical protein [Lachnospiraceae bacterium]
MRYSYEFKRKCVEMYRKGILPDILDGITKREFQRQIRRWTRIEDANGPTALKHKSQNKYWTPEEKLFHVAKALAFIDNEKIDEIAKKHRV